MVCMLSFQVAAQMILPAWVRGRGLSITMMSFTAGMTVGSILWGVLAKATSMKIAFDIAAVTMVLGALLTTRYQISSNETEDA